MSSQISNQTKENDSFKNDFQNARKRNLHIWMRWRSEVNDQLATSVFTGRHRVDVEPLDTYLYKTDHPSENPKTLLTYSASVDNISSLGVKRFLHYGIPRVKTSKKRTFTFSKSKIKDKTNRSKYTDEPLLEDEEIENIDINFKSKDNISKDDNIISIQRDDNGNTSFHDINENRNGNVIPYYEPDPDYESPDQGFNSPGTPRSPGPGSSIDNITSPGTSFAGNVSNTSTSESEPEECPYVTRQRRAEMFVANNTRKSIPTISRTYSTLNALDPTYVKSNDVKKGKASTKKKKKKDKDKDGSWKSFESSANSKSTDSKSKRSPLGNLFRKTSDAISKQFHSHSKNKSNCANASDAKLKEGIYKTTVEVIYESPNEHMVHGDKANNDRSIYNSPGNSGSKAKNKQEQIYEKSRNVRREDIYGNHPDHVRHSQNRNETIYSKRKDGSLNTNNPIISKYGDFKHLKQDRSDAIYDGYADNIKFQSYDHVPFVDSDNIKIRPSQTNKKYSKRDCYKNDHSRTSDIKSLRQSQISSHFYGGSMDVYATGRLEPVEFTKEPRRLGNYRGPDSKIYASHSVLHTKGFDNWGFH